MAVYVHPPFQERNKPNPCGPLPSAPNPCREPWSGTAWHPVMHTGPRTRAEHINMLNLGHHDCTQMSPPGLT